ncbi:MAG: cell division protein SepF [Promethearchaeota archaeon]|nr:MAG: cell division protein SepF [Candidatus Lokiarchaeota archaeon]
MVGLFGNKNQDKSEEILDSPEKTLGFSRESIKQYQSFLIQKFDLTSLSEIKDVKTKLMDRKILILNVKELLKKKEFQVLELKAAIDELKSFLSKNGGSMGRIGEHILILTPNQHVRISN